MKKILSSLSDDLMRYDRVFLFDGGESLVQLYLCTRRGKENKKCLVLSTEFDLPTCGSFDFRKISKEEGKLLTDLYFTYEFSDRFCLISRKQTCYPDFWNLLDSEMIGAEEAFEALQG